MEGSSASMNGPRVSIIIPAYNSGAWIAHTLETVRAQTHLDLDVLVIDDGSTDGTADIVESINDPRIRLIRQSNSGACVARNRGLDEATGQFIQFLDADDLLSANKIERQLQRLAKEPKGTLATCSWARFRNEDVSTAHFFVEHDWKDYKDPLDWLIDCGIGRGTMPIHSWLIPREVAQEAGPWNERLRINQDGEYNARLVLAAGKIAFVQEAKAYYRSGLEGSISRGDSREALESLMDATDLISACMLERRDDARVREAAAGLYRHVSMRAFPRFRDISERAEVQVANHGGSRRLPGGGRVFRVIRDIIGWKPAMRFQSLYRALRF
jgi:glycosyltransferase involved in cell wall biosynthesis